MKKMIKMSLVAATAVASLTSTASAGNLTEMIKDTKMTGYVRYRLETDHETNNEGDMNEKAKAVAKFTTPVNDMVAANVKIVAGESNTQNADTQAEVAVKEANFVVKASGSTIIAGLQTSQSPFFANNGDTRSHGLTALIPAGPATIAAAYYTTTTGAGFASPAMTNNVVALGALAKFGAINANLWYADVQDGSDLENGNDKGLKATLDTLFGFNDASAMSIELKAKVANLNIQLMRTELENANLTGELTKLVASGKAGKISYAAAYAMTGDEKVGGTTGGRVTIDGDDDAKSDLAMYSLSMQATTDASAFYLMGGYKISDKLSASLEYLNGSEGSKGNDKDFNEIDVKVGYAMSKNFNIGLTYAIAEYNNTDMADSRIEVKYTF